MQMDKEELEQLASSRTEIKEALQIISDASNMNGEETNIQRDNSCYFVNTASFSSSFFQMDEGGAESFLRGELKKVEEQIVELCSQIQRSLEESKA